MSDTEIKGKKPSSYAKCAICKKPLQGVSRKNLRKLSISEKRPSRMFGGNLCSSCTREKLKERIRKETGERRLAKAISS